MALLAFCWLRIIESVVIPDGIFLKWFYLSFYIHPIFLCFCQIFLWLKLLKTWLLPVVIYPFKTICFVGLYVFRLFRVCIACMFSFLRGTQVLPVEEITVDNFEDAVDDFSQNQLLGLDMYRYSSIPPVQIFKLEGFELQKICDHEYYEVGRKEENSDMEEQNFCDENSGEYDENSLKDESSDLEDNNFCLQEDERAHDDQYSSSSSISDSSTSSIDEASLNVYPISSFCYLQSSAEDPDLKEASLAPVDCTSNSLALERKTPNGAEDGESEEFYKNYSEKMRWFNLLNHDRTCGISAILNKELGTPISFESIKPKDLSFPYISWSKIAKKRLLRSLESDFELVYVAQSCLSWEALYYQYRKVNILASLTSSFNGFFSENVVGEFQKFQVLLERFLEDERCTEAKRVWNYVRGRFASNSLLQVPKLSGEMKGEAVNVREILKAIEKCIRAYWAFVKTDNKKPWWKFKSSLWTYPPVEDPRDLELLADLTRTLQKKELYLKDLQGKRRCWFNKIVTPLEESQKKEMLFTMIDMKLVSRVLQMSVVSSSQLKWCQDKLNNIEFKEGKVFRADGTAPLFPS